VDLIVKTGGKNMWKNSKVYIMGAGKSGLAAAEYFIRQGSQVWLNDEKEKNSLNGEAIDTLAAKGVIIELGFPGEPLKYQVDLIVQSPGIPLDKPALAQAAAAGIPITNEIEVGFQATKARTMGITGSNGKTTTTTLLGEIMKNTDTPVFIGGNIGIPFIEVAEELPEDSWAVLELSSFQLETIRSFRPNVGVILNFSPDHLDRHKTYENYCNAKWRIAEFQTADDYLVLNKDDSRICQYDLDRIKSHKVFFSRKERLEEGAWVDANGIIQMSWKGVTVPILPAAALKIPGSHNLENALAAVAAAFVAGVDTKIIADSIMNFKGVPHRIETVVESGGVLFVNDSKGTNIDAAIKAIDAFDRPIILIAGGLGKGAGYQQLAEKIKEKVKLLVLIGQEKDKIEAAVREVGFTNIIKAASMEEAVAVSGSNAAAGDVVLLSPACASFDMFKSYAQRGDRFKEAVFAWTAKRGE